ncbi:MAG: nicotinate-nucleotide diphosphorylase (carboxylating) [Desulfobacteraceae bacterium]|nr:nicotinate-nucleotide diphosphorylase (carboxylating) [Desulfobacteraceae bacterium]
MDMMEQIISLALFEDSGLGDITSESILPASRRGTGVITAKQDCVLAGTGVAQKTFQMLDPDVDIRMLHLDGDFVQKGSVVLEEKQAVRAGGGSNHRFSLFDGILIKDNHIAVAGGIAAAVQAVRERTSHLMKIEVEVSDMDQVRQALAAKADVIMLDNMSCAAMKQAVDFINGRAVVEASGNVCLETLNVIAATGVDVISCGALTHQARAVDLSMRITPHQGVSRM